MSEGEVSPDIQLSIDVIVASGFVNPIYLTNAGDGSGRIFVVEQAGKIKILQNGEVMLKQSILLKYIITMESH